MVVIVQISLLIVTFLSLVSHFFLGHLCKMSKKSTHTLALRHVECHLLVLILLLLMVPYLLNIGACICHIGQECQVEWTTPREVRRRMTSNSIVSHGKLIP